MPIRKHLIACIVELLVLALAGTMKALPPSNDTASDFEVVPQNRISEERVRSYSPDGEYFVSGSDDSRIKLFTKHCTLLRIFEEHSSRVVSVSFTSDGEHVISGSQDRTVKLWNLLGEVIRSYGGFWEHPEDISFSSDAEYIFIESTSDTLVLKIQHGVVEAFEGHPGPSLLYYTSFKNGRLNPGGKALNDPVNNVSLVELINNIQARSGELETAGVSPDGQYLVSSAGDSIIKLWNLRGELLKTFRNPSGPVLSVLFSSDSRHIISRSSDKTTRLWDLKGNLVAASVHLAPQRYGATRIYGMRPASKSQLNEGCLETGEHLPIGSIVSVAFSPDGKYLASGFRREPVNLWSMEGNLIRSIGGTGSHTELTFSLDSKYIIAASGSIKSVLSPDGRHLLSTGSSMRLWDLQGNNIRTLIRPSTLAGTDHGADPVCLWRMDGRFITALHDDSGRILTAVFSPDGEFIATGQYNAIKLWDLKGKIVRTIDAGYPPEAFDSLAFTPDGKHIISENTSGQIALWNTEGTLVRIIRKVPTRKGLSFAKMSLSPDGKYIATGPEGKDIKILDLEGNLVRTLKGSYLSTQGTFSPDGKFFAVGFIDGIINLWNLKIGTYFSMFSTNLPQVVSAPDGTPFNYPSMTNDWIMYAPDGYFDASPYGGKLVAMVKGLKAYGMDQLAVRYNRPDLILERMGLGTPERISYYNLLYQKRLKKLGLTEASLNSELHMPEARITAARQDGKSVNIGFFLSDRKYPLQCYNIYVNNVPFFGPTGKEIRGNSFKGSENIELTLGRNRIELSVMNSVGIESYRPLVNADYSAYPQSALYYLAFGISKYKDPTLNLDYAAKDVQDLGNIVSKMHWRYPYPVIHKKILLNEAVTAKAIQAAKSFLEKAGVDDTVILAISGHGGHNKGRDARYYFVAHETNMDDLAGTGVDFESIEALLNGIKPRRKLFLLDTCDSGEIDEDTYTQYYTAANTRGLKPRTYRKPKISRGNVQKEERSNVYEKNRLIYSDLSRRTGTIVFSSSRGGEISYESSAIQNGFFTKAVISALTSRAADTDGDGKIDSNELRAFVTGAVPAETGGLQHPTIDRDNLYQTIELPLVTNK